MRLVEAGKPYRFKKGEPSPNKGKRQCDFMTADGIERSKATRFKKNEVPHNIRPVNSEKINKQGFVVVKVETSSERAWRLKHIIEWEKHNGKVPNAHIIRFKDGDKTNCDIDNLYLVPRAVIAMENSFNNYPEELKEVIRLTSKLNRAVQKAKNK